MIYWLARMSGFWDAAEIGPGRSRIENDANDSSGRAPWIPCDDRVIIDGSRSMHIFGD